ncbi:MAG: hypothetical protein ACRBBT_06150 [Paracoccaceae bacterium]
MRLFLSALVALCLGLAAPLAAKGMAEAEQAALAQTIDEFSTAMKADDFARVIATLPPRLMQAMSAQTGMPVDQLRNALAAQSAQVMGDSSVETFDTDLSDLNAKTGKMPDGSKVLYTFVPAQVEMTVKGKPISQPQNLLALKEDGAWYLMRVQSDGHVKMLQAIYPFFKRRDFKF